MFGIGGFSSRKNNILIAKLRLEKHNIFFFET